MDAYDKMAQFLVDNAIWQCDFCVAIEMYGNNDCCDHKKWCVKGIAEYAFSYNHNYLYVPTISKESHPYAPKHTLR